MTEIRTFVTAGTERIALYGLVAPSTGANTVSITFSAGTSERVAFAVNFTGVNQGTPTGAEAEEEVTSSIHSTDITLTYTNSWVVELEETTQASGTFTQDSGQDERQEYSGSSDYSGAIATKSFTAIGTESLQYTSNINTQQAQILVELVDARNAATNVLIF